MSTILIVVLVIFIIAGVFLLCRNDAPQYEVILLSIGILLLTISLGLTLGGQP